MRRFFEFIRRRRRRIVVGGFLLVILVALLFVGSDRLVASAAKGRIFESIDALPHMKVALVLGTSPTAPSGATNVYFAGRIATAAEVYRAGKVDYLLVSGDNSRAGYDEPTAMKDALIARGVPAERIVCDFGGLRTLDSVYRAKRIFGQSAHLIISQREHNERALFLAKSTGIDAVAVNAPVEGSAALIQKNAVRENLARAAAVIDVYVLRRQPKLLGDPITIGVRDDSK
jgi:SanA protein